MTVRMTNKEWMKKCLKAGMKRSTCNRIAKIRRQKGFGRAPRYSDLPEGHRTYAVNLTEMSNSYLDLAKQALDAKGDCTEAFKKGTQAQSTARAAVEHATSAVGSASFRTRESSQAYAAIRDADDFLFGTFMRQCVRKRRGDS